jgi:hypothetical protein
VDVQMQTKPWETCHNLIFVCKNLKQYCKLRTNKNHNKPFFHDQILFLFINYPSGCNLPTLCVTGSWGWRNNVWHRHELPLFFNKGTFYFEVKECSDLYTTMVHLTFTHYEHQGESKLYMFSWRQIK